MKKLTIILVLTFTLLAGGTISAGALTVGSGFSSGHAEISIDARDSHNRPVESSFAFRDTVFTRVYSKISPFGVTRRVSSNFPSEELLPNYILELPLLMVSFISGREELQPPLIAGQTHPMGAANIIFTASILGAFMLLFCIKLPSKEEPRFRVPVFLE